MKTSRYSNLACFIIIIAGLFFLSSCGTARVRKLQLSAREESPELFIQKRDKQILPISDFKKFDYDLDSLVALQNKMFFMRVDDGEEYVRLMKGRMNMYYRYTNYMTSSFGTPTPTNPSGFSSSNRTKVSRYFDLGIDQPLIRLDRQSLGKPTAGCITCLNVLQDYDRTRKTLKWWKYGNWAAIAGSLVIAFTGDDNVSDDSDLRIYGFAGLFFGGLFSEIYRITRVHKNEVRLEEAVVEFNRFSY